MPTAVRTSIQSHVSPQNFYVILLGGMEGGERGGRERGGGERKVGWLVTKLIRVKIAVVNNVAL